MKTEKPTNKKRTVIFGAGLIILSGVLWYYLDHRADTKPIEYPFTACQGELCIKGKQMGKVDNCIVNERQERICGNYVLTIDSRVQVSVQQ